MNFVNGIESIRQTYPEAASVRPVRIAIVDDGLQLAASQRFNVVGGQSFCKEPGTGHFKDFWVDPGSHGTQMARYITKICPMANLIIVRLFDERGRDEGRPSPTAASAAEVCAAT